MPPLVLPSLEGLKKLVGQEIGCSEWFVVTQDRIQRFAEATEDRQWIHLDRERAGRESPSAAASGLWSRRTGFSDSRKPQKTGSGFTWIGSVLGANRHTEPRLPMVF